MLANGVLLSLQYNFNKYAKIRLFMSHLVREINGKMTNKPYEMSRLGVQGYNYIEKTALLTQTLTIQRCSQCLLLSITPTLRKRRIKIML